MVLVAECCTPFDNFYRENKIFGPFSERIFECVKERQCLYDMYFQAPSLFSHNAITMHVSSVY